MITKVTTFSSQVHYASLNTLAIRVSQTRRARTFPEIWNSILNWTANVILTAIGALIRVRSRTVLARVMTIFTIH